MSPVSAVANASAFVLEPFPRGEVGGLLDDVGRREPPDVADDAELTAVDDRAGPLDVVLAVLQVTGRPHLERRVDVAVGHRRELARLVDLLQLDRAAHLALHHGLRHGGVRLGAHPRVDRDRDRVAAALRGRCRRCRCRLRRWSSPPSSTSLQAARTSVATATADTPHANLCFLIRSPSLLVVFDRLRDRAHAEPPAEPHTHGTPHRFRRRPHRLSYTVENDGEEQDADACDHATSDLLLARARTRPPVPAPPRRSGRR